MVDGDFIVNRGVGSRLSPLVSQFVAQNNLKNLYAAYAI